MFLIVSLDLNISPVLILHFHLSVGLLVLRVEAVPCARFQGGYTLHGWLTTFSAQEVTIGWPGPAQAPAGCLFFQGCEAEFLNQLLRRPAGRGGRAFCIRIPLPAQTAVAAWGRGGRGVGEGRAAAWGRGEPQSPESRPGRVQGQSPSATVSGPWTGPLFTVSGEPCHKTGKPERPLGFKGSL
jgi:hypothetical protein